VLVPQRGQVTAPKKGPIKQVKPTDSNNNLVEIKCPTEAEMHVDGIARAKAGRLMK
jgi:hypothetical protein